MGSSEKCHNMPDGGRLLSWLCTLDSSQGKKLPGPDLFALLTANTFSGDIPVAGLASLVLGKWRLLGDLVPLLHFPDGETDWDRGCQWPLLPPAFAQLLSWYLEFGDLAPAAFLCQSWPKGCICYGGRRH